MVVLTFLIFSISIYVLHLREMKAVGEVSLPCGRWEECNLKFCMLWLWIQPVVGRLFQINHETSKIPLFGVK